MSETVVKKAYSLTERQMEYVNRIIVLLSVCLAVSMVGCGDSNRSIGPASGRDTFTIGSSNGDDRPEIDPDEGQDKQDIVDLTLNTNNQKNNQMSNRKNNQKN